MKWFVSAWTIWGLRAEWTLNMGTEASKGWLFCGDAARSRISQDRKNVFLRNCAYCGFEYICRTVVWLQQQALRWEAARLRLQLKELRMWTGWKNLLWRWRLQDFDNFSGQAKYVFILRIVQTVVLKNCRTCAAMCGNWIIGFKRRGVIWSWGASEVLKIQGLVKCWHFVKFGLCVKSLYTFDEIKNSTPEGILIIF